ncbi:hypothetical protein DFJ73DRAFT_841525 [Zopfochytrium polystomum]|nr:hypothetical protein DFJ73DRAFT_841525 [Zopfochytrium polystomum]
MGGHHQSSLSPTAHPHAQNYLHPHTRAASTSMFDPPHLTLSPSTTAVRRHSSIPALKVTAPDSPPSVQRDGLDFLLRKRAEQYRQSMSLTSPQDDRNSGQSSPTSENFAALGMSPQKPFDEGTLLLDIPMGLWPRQTVSEPSSPLHRQQTPSLLSTHSGSSSLLSPIENNSCSGPWSSNIPSPLSIGNASPLVQSPSPLRSFTQLLSETDLLAETDALHLTDSYTSNATGVVPHHQSSEETYFAGAVSPNQTPSMRGLLESSLAESWLGHQASQLAHDNETNRLHMSLLDSLALFRRDFGTSVAAPRAGPFPPTLQDPPPSRPRKRAKGKGSSMPEAPSAASLQLLSPASVASATTATNATLLPTAQQTTSNSVMRPRPYACDHRTCTKSFLRKQDLIRHAATHLPRDLRPFECPNDGCVRRYGRIDAVLRHARVFCEFKKEGEEGEIRIEHVLKGVAGNMDVVEELAEKASMDVMGAVVGETLARRVSTEARR